MTTYEIAARFDFEAFADRFDDPDLGALAAMLDDVLGVKLVHHPGDDGIVLFEPVEDSGPSPPAPSATQPAVVRASGLETGASGGEEWPPETGPSIPGPDRGGRQMTNDGDSE